MRETMKPFTKFASPSSFADVTGDVERAQLYIRRQAEEHRVQVVGASMTSVGSYDKERDEERYGVPTNWADFAADVHESTAQTCAAPLSYIMVLKGGPMRSGM